MSDYVCVIGGVNMDIGGTPKDTLVLNDSNPGKVSLSPGGVSRNIAENLRRLGINVELITIFGNDGYAHSIKRNCYSLGIGVEYSETIEDGRTSTYLFINNHLGDMEVGISDMEIYKHMTPEYLSIRLDLINDSTACVLDTNIPTESLKYLMDNVTVPIFLDTVSTKKTKKIAPFIHNIFALKPNRIEAEILSGIEINSEKDYKTATDIILNKGIERVYLSLGADGVYYNNGEVQGHHKALPGEIVNATGSGDSFIAAVLWSYLNGLSFEDSTKAGISAAHICSMSESTVSKDISADNIKNIMKNNWR